MTVSIEIPEYNSKELLSQIDSALQNGATQRAWYLLGKYCEQNPSDTLAFSKLEECCVILEADETKKLSRKERKAEKNRIPAYISLAYYYIFKGEMSKAYRQAGRVLRVDKKNIIAKDMRKWIEKVNPEVTQCLNLSLLEGDKPDTTDPSPKEEIQIEDYPEMIKAVNPKYPRHAEEAGITGRVYIMSLLNEKGKVIRAMIGKSSGMTPSIWQHSRQPMKTDLSLAIRIASLSRSGLLTK